jgi:exodeoxyribonuclease-3
MRVITVNTNGIRAAAKKGFYSWLRRQKADVVCLQETRAHVEQLDSSMFWPPGFHCYYHSAEKKGYSGVAIYCREEPDAIIYGLNWPEFDSEGRWIEARFGNLSVVSLYLPSGSHSEERQQFKFQTLDRLLPVLKAKLKEKRDYIICGDWNIAHREIDLKNWRANQKNSGFLPEERAWMDKLFDSRGYLDAFRLVDQRAEQYTWWSNRGRAWDNNVGWRIDYQIISPGLSECVDRASIYRKKRYSDHAPLTVDFDYAG